MGALLIMRVSAKSRYALASVISMGQNYNNGGSTTVISISEKLDISKIYLEQVFTLLKKGSIVNSVKGSQGGYLLTRPPQQITVYDILSAIESSLFEPAEDTVSKKSPAIESAMQKFAFEKLDLSVESTLKNITVLDLINEAEKYKATDEIMFYI